MSTRLDVGDLLIAAGLLAITIWLLSQGEWTGILGLAFPLWWGWQIVRDRTLSLDLQGLNVSAGPEERTAWMPDPEFEIVCCFCGKSVEQTTSDPGSLEFYTRAGDWEAFSCHVGCFKTRLSGLRQQ